jgi:cytochrome c oxidase cbb3-type subunit 3
MRRSLVGCIVVALLCAACEREERELRFSPEQSKRIAMVPVTDFRPGGSPLPPSPVKSPFEDNAYAVAEGKRMYSWFNCVGCHAHGGGGIGPPLMDAGWIYGGRPEQIYASIVQGRPNGMPSFGERLDEPTRWRLVAYVQSLAGHVPTDVAPGRDDTMAAAPAESRRPREPIEQTGSQP